MKTLYRMFIAAVFAVFSGFNAPLSTAHAQGMVTALVNFNNSNGANPLAGLTLGSDGNFYGTANQGGSYGYDPDDGSYGYGTVFEVTTDGTLTTLVSFNGTDGYYPYAGLTLGPDGSFYGTTFGGTVFQVTTNGTLTTLVSFNDTDGEEPEAGLTLGPDGNFYGMTSLGGSDNHGTVFQVTTGGTLTTLAIFNGDNGADPKAALTLGLDGNFYGTTAGGGSDGYGTVFQVTTNGTLTTLVSFNETDGEAPVAALTLGPDGNFYGTTEAGGSDGDGTVFQVTTNGALTTLASFDDTDGADPKAALTLGPDGNFYGTTYVGGSDDDGTVFRMTPNGTLTTLYSFSATSEFEDAYTNSDGAGPSAGLTLGPDGNFYGTTIGGGTNGDGVVYRLDLPPEIIQPSTNETILAGSQATFSVLLFGTAPYSYQWLSNSIPIVGATNDVLTISNASAADDADYSMIVTNAFGSVTNSVASLTVATLQVNSIAEQSGSVTLNFSGVPNATTRLWATTNLAVPSDWTVIYTNTVTTTNGSWQFTDTNLYQQRYYRISEP